MIEAILTVSHWLHSISTVIWIGGMFFILFITLPSIKNIPGIDSGKLMGEISKRFTPLVNYSIFLLIITGLVLTILRSQFSGADHFFSKWTLVLVIKHFFIVGMILIHFYRNLILIPKIGKMDNPHKKTGLQKFSLKLVYVNFYLGLIVLFCSGIISLQY